jgi:hypothetical protein
MSWIDTAIITTVVIVGLFILYRALKEPLDLLFGFIGKIIISIKDKFSDMNTGDQYEVIKYG